MIDETLSQLTALPDLLHSIADGTAAEQTAIHLYRTNGTLSMEQAQILSIGLNIAIREIARLKP